MVSPIGTVDKSFLMYEVGSNSHFWLFVHVDSKSAFNLSESRKNYVHMAMSVLFSGSAHWSYLYG